ncbi:MAG: tRNA (cytidine(34)-2'-O)-methyltransferase [Flavobacteriales bacterium]
MNSEAPLYNIVLVEPQIPNNTGNIGRTCVAANSKLHLIHPLGFEITDTRVKRAGLDYWPDLNLQHHADFSAFLSAEQHPKRLFFFSAHATKSFYDVSLEQGDYLIFGREADGLSDELKTKYASQLVKIPFPGKVRSFNLSNAVAMALGEGMRQFQS